jgi:hypothetical protein
MVVVVVVVAVVGVGPLVVMQLAVVCVGLAR